MLFISPVSDTLTSLPVIEGTGGSIQLRVGVNTSVIADGTSALILFSPTSNLSVSPVEVTAQVSGGMLLVQASNLNPSTDYNYTLTLDSGVGEAKLGDTIQGIFRTNSKSPISIIIIFIVNHCYMCNMLKNFLRRVSRVGGLWNGVME